MNHFIRRLRGKNVIPYTYIIQHCTNTNIITTTSNNNSNWKQARIPETNKKSTGMSLRDREYCFLYMIFVCIFS